MRHTLETTRLRTHDSDVAGSVNNFPRQGYRIGGRQFVTRGRRPCKGFERSEALTLETFTRFLHLAKGKHARPRQRNAMPSLCRTCLHRALSHDEVTLTCKECHGCVTSIQAVVPCAASGSGCFLTLWGWLAHTDGPVDPPRVAALALEDASQGDANAVTFVAEVSSSHVAAGATLVYTVTLGNTTTITPIYVGRPDSYHHWPTRKGCVYWGLECTTAKASPYSLSA